MTPPRVQESEGGGAIKEAPQWCGYPEPARPATGCWLLLDGWITEQSDCDCCQYAAVERAAKEAGE